MALHNTLVLLFVLFGSQLTLATALNFSALQLPSNNTSLATRWPPVPFVITGGPTQVAIKDYGQLAPPSVAWEVLFELDIFYELILSSTQPFTSYSIQLQSKVITMQFDILDDMSFGRTDAANVISMLQAAMTEFGARAIEKAEVGVLVPRTGAYPFAAEVEVKFTGIVATS